MNTHAQKPRHVLSRQQLPALFHALTGISTRASVFALGGLLLINACEQPYGIYQTNMPASPEDLSSKDGQKIRSGDTVVSRLPGFNDDIKHDHRDELAPGYIAYSNLYHVDVAQRKVDLIFVLDNSNSMAEEQASVINSFESFLKHFVDRDIDYHIGVLSTDASALSANWNSSNPAYTGYQTDGAGSFLAKSTNPRFITNKDGADEAIRQFRENASLGVGGNPAETGILSLQAALSPTKLAGWNQGFLRPDALLSMIVLSDEDESTSPDDPTYLRKDAAARAARVQNFTSRLAQIKAGHPGLIRFDAIVAPSQADCPSLGNSAGLAGTGDVYMSVAKLLSVDKQNHIFNICQDFSDSFINLGSEISVQIERDFELTQVPIGTIVVKLDGVEINEDSHNGWTYDFTTNTISLHGLNLENKGEFDVRVNFVHR